MLMTVAPGAVSVRAAVTALAALTWPPPTEADSTRMRGAVVMTAAPAFVPFVALQLSARRDRSCHDDSRLSQWHVTVTPRPRRRAGRRRRANELSRGAAPSGPTLPAP